MKWSQKTKTFTTCSSWSSSTVISMLVKSTWTRIACRGTFTLVPSCCIHLSQLLITFCICIAMPDHQNQSCSRDNVHHRLWCPASLWHPFIGTTLWPVGTTNCFFQLSSQCMAVVKGTLMECEFLPLPKDGNVLFCHGMVSQEMSEILYFMEGNSLYDNFEFGIFLFHSYPVHCMQVYMCMSGPCLNCMFFCLLMYPFISLSHYQIMGISPSCGPYSDPVQDGLHSFCIQLWYNMAQIIQNSIVYSFLIFNAKCNSC